MAKNYNAAGAKYVSPHAAPKIIDNSLPAQAANLSPQERAKINNRDLDAFQYNLGYEFNDKILLDEALCHSSFAHEHGLYVNNERLEFLGDSVLSFIVARSLYKMYPDATEGELTHMRSELVCAESLVRRAVGIKLPEMILLGRSFKLDTPKSLYEDALEAVIGAVCLDGGIAAAEKVVKKLFLKISDLQKLSAFDEAAAAEKKAKNFYKHNDNVSDNKDNKDKNNDNYKNDKNNNKNEKSGKSQENFINLNINGDPKSRLQVWLQARHLPLPVYELISVTGPDHAPEFLVRAKISGTENFEIKNFEIEKTASGLNKKSAEALAAAQILSEIENKGF